MDCEKSGQLILQLRKENVLTQQEIAYKDDIAMCHAIGQACAAVHTAGHAIGYPIYNLTAIIYKYGIENCSKIVETRKQEYIDRLFYWNEHLKEYQGEWAEFMLK